MTEPPSRRDRWLGVELRHLAALAAVARAGSFKNAAGRLGYAQSAVSQQISFLERRVGRRLVERGPGPGPVALTDAGHVLVAHAERILGRLEAADADLRALDEGDRATIRIGISPCMARRLLPVFLAALEARRPDLHVIAMEIACQEERLRRVEERTLAAAFVEMPTHQGPFEVEELFVDPYILLVPADSPLAALEQSPSLAEIRTLRLFGSAAARLHGEAQRRQEESLADSTAQALVANGLGAAVLPRIAVEADEQTVPLEVGHFLPPRVVGLCWHGQQPPHGEALAAVRSAAEWSAELLLRTDAALRTTAVRRPQP